MAMKSVQNSGKSRYLADNKAIELDPTHSQGRQVGTTLIALGVGARANTPLRGTKKLLCTPRSCCEEDADYTIKVLNMIKLHGKSIRVNKASQDKKIIDVGANLWKQLKPWLMFTLLPNDVH
ncbi:Nucleotide-binding alpha-beta plait domain protein [Raphanus sativus]|nr:Nucleotide-binding alpha-beta plait domain protein [Raphanus sativus]